MQFISRKIPTALRVRLVDPANVVMFSAISIAEIAIKSSLGRPDFPFQPEEVTDAALRTGFVELPLLASQSSVWPRCRGITELLSTDS